MANPISRSPTIRQGRVGIPGNDHGRYHWSAGDWLSDLAGHQGPEERSLDPAGTAGELPAGCADPVQLHPHQVNGWEKTVNSYGAYVVRLARRGKSLVFSNMCTHLSCRVTWNEDLRQYICPCHDAHFDLDGEVTARPAAAPAGPSMRPRSKRATCSSTLWKDNYGCKSFQLAR